MQTRRDFVRNAASLGASIAVGNIFANGVVGFGQEKLRFGVISDVHISTERQLPCFKAALQRLDRLKVDAVLCCGDIANYGMEAQLKLAADAWFEVFPSNHSSVDGRSVANLLHYGDHDMQDERYIDRPDAVERWPNRDERLNSVIHPKSSVTDFEARAKAAWERCFKCNDWDKLVVKDVKGYKFVLSHFTRGETGNQFGNNVPGLSEFLLKCQLDLNKPFFYSQHRIPKLTTCGSDVFGQDDGQSTRILSKYPNLVAFCGHAHQNCVQENNIWQGAFTCIQVPSLRYTCTLPGRENSYSNGYDLDADGDKLCMSRMSGGVGQGYVCVVFEKALVVQRLNLTTGKKLGPDWVVPFSSFEQDADCRPFSVQVRASVEPPPEFVLGASVAIGPVFRGKDRGYKKGKKIIESELHTMTQVSFPAVRSCLDRPRAADYKVSVEARNHGRVSLGKVKYVYSPDIHEPEEFLQVSVTCLFTEKQLPKAGAYRFRVEPRNAWGRCGKAIYSDWVEL